MRLKLRALLWLCFVSLGGCLAQPAQDPAAVIDHAWALIDTRYALFPDKAVDWPAAKRRAHEALDGLSADGRLDEGALHDVLSDMLAILEDGHVNVITPFAVSWAPAWFEARAPQYDADLVHRHVLGFDFRRIGPLEYGRLDRWGYLRVRHLSSMPDADVLAAVFEGFQGAEGLIVDLRANGGGELSHTETMLRRLLRGPQVAWRIETKQGPEHDALGGGTTYEIAPSAGPGFTGPLAVLIDGRTYSGANLMAFTLAERPGATLVGERTGGGGGSTAWFELPNGWSMRLPIRRITTGAGEPTELGVAPDIERSLDPLLAAEGRDSVIEAGIRALEASAEGSGSADESQASAQGAGATPGGSR